MHPTTPSQTQFPIPHHCPKTKKKFKNLKISDGNLHSATQASIGLHAHATRRAATQPTHASFLGKDYQAMRGEALTEKKISHSPVRRG
jgi:hypothetical protein